MFPTLFQFGSFVFPTYGVLVVIGLISGLMIAARLAKREGIPEEQIYNLGVYLALAGIIGSKVALIIQDFDYYRLNPRQLFSMSTLQSGGIFYGGLIAGLLVAIWYTRRMGVPFFKAGDILAPGVALGHAFGRIGCFAAGCCWGEPTSVPWAVTFTNPYSHEVVGVPLNVPLHPTQLYESAAEFFIFWYLYRRFARKQFEGEIFGWYLILYSIARFIIEIFRSHEVDAVLWKGGLSAAQGISIVLFFFGAWLLWFRPHGAARTSPVVSPKSAAR